MDNDVRENTLNMDNDVRLVWFVVAFLQFFFAARVEILCSYCADFLPLAVESWMQTLAACSQMLSLAVMVKVLMICMKGLKVVEGILEKNNYMERRLMRLQYSHADATGQLAQEVEEFEEARSSKLWLERRLRDHYEACLKSGSRAGCCIRMQL